MTARTTAEAGRGAGLRERNKRRRTRRILAATRELIRERPDRSPTVEAIAARAEVAPATIFNLVGPRERIWAAIADESLAEAERRVAALVEPDPHHRARRIAAVTLDVLLEDPAVQRHVLSHWTESGRLLRRGPVGGLRRCLRQAQEEAGSLRGDVGARTLAESIFTGCTGALHQWAAGLIGDSKLRRRCSLAVDLAFLAAAADEKTREAFLGAASELR